MAIRVLHVIDHLGYGGAPVVVKNIVESAADAGVVHTVLALRANPRPIHIDAPVITLPYHKFSPRIFSAIPAVCREHRIDIVHAHLQKSIIGTLLVGRRCGVPVIVHGHGPIFGEGYGRVYRTMLRMLRRRVSRVIANSDATRLEMHRAAGIPLEHIDVVGNFIDLARFDPSVYDRGRARSDLGLKPDDIAIGFAGRFDACKGIDLLLHAAARLCDEDRRYRIILVGYGREEQGLRRLVAELDLRDRVIFTGLHENPAEVMAGFDMAVIPSRREAFGIVAVELMAMRVPVIASAVGGLPELVRHDQTGLLLGELSAEGIFRAVRELAGDHDLRNRLIRNGAELARQFDGRKQMEAINRIYLKLCPPAPSATY